LKNIVAIFIKNTTLVAFLLLSVQTGVLVKKWNRMVLYISKSTRVEIPSCLWIWKNLPKPLFYCKIWSYFSYLFER